MIYKLLHECDNTKTNRHVFNNIDRRIEGKWPVFPNAQYLSVGSSLNLGHVTGPHDLIHHPNSKNSGTQLTKIHLIAAARPNFMKVAPLYHALKATDWAQPKLIHTGQHYDVNMSDVFFQDLQLPPPDHHLEIGSGSHAE